MTQIQVPMHHIVQLYQDFVDDRGTPPSSKQCEPTQEKWEAQTHTQPPDYDPHGDAQAYQDHPATIVIDATTALMDDHAWRQLGRALAAVPGAYPLGVLVCDDDREHYPRLYIRSHRISLYQPDSSGPFVTNCTVSHRRHPAVYGHRSPVPQPSVFLVTWPCPRCR